MHTNKIKKKNQFVARPQENLTPLNKIIVQKVHKLKKNF